MDAPLDIEVLFTDGEPGSGQGVPISPGTVEQTAQKAVEMFRKLIPAYGKEMQADLQHRYEGALKGRDRPRADLPTLRQVIMDALGIRRVLDGNDGQVEVNVFHTNKARDATGGRAWGFTRGGNLFDLLEFGSGGSGTIDGSTEHGFISLQTALAVADQASSAIQLPEFEKMLFMQHVLDSFGGRHWPVDQDKSEVGISVPLNEPLFFSLPRWGPAGPDGLPPVRYAREWAEPHTTASAMRVLPTYPGPLSLMEHGTSESWLADLAQGILTAVTGRMQKG